MVLETVEDALANTPKYVVTPNGDGANPDLWFSMPPFAQVQFPGSQTPTEPENLEGGQRDVLKKFSIKGEEDMIDAITRYHQERAGADQ
jgi:hypothetical protein